MTKEQQIKIQRCIDEFYSNRPQVRDELGAALQVLYEAEPTKHGEWIPGKEIAREFLAGNVIYVDYLNYRCSVCGATVGERETMMYHFCPNCGARMDLNEVGENDQRGFD